MSHPAAPSTTPQAHAASPCAHTQRFPAIAAQVPKARRFLASLLDGSRLASDALLCLSELATNAIQHSNSHRPGGYFTVTVTLTAGRLRVEVEDQGGPWQQQTPATESMRGRGLQIVAALADWGVSGDGTGPRTVWFQIPAGSSPATFRQFPNDCR